MTTRVELNRDERALLDRLRSALRKDGVELTDEDLVQAILGAAAGLSDEDLVGLIGRGEARIRTRAE